MEAVQLFSRYLISSQYRELLVLYKPTSCYGIGETYYLCFKLHIFFCSAHKYSGPHNRYRKATLGSRSYSQRLRDKNHIARAGQITSDGD